MSSPEPIDPYLALGVPQDATLVQIKSSHRKLVLKFHPDRIKDEAQRAIGREEFEKVQHAYELLSDESKRTRYDQKIKLAELRKQALERAGPVRAASYSTRDAPRREQSYEYRDGRVYEERVPSGTKFFPEDDRYTEEPRGSARKYDGYERRPSVQHDDRKKTKAPALKPDHIRILKDRAREAREHTKSNHSERAKTRDQDRRKDARDKYSRSAYVESDSDSDSDTATYVSTRTETRRSEPSKERYDEPPPRKSNVDSPRRKEVRRDRDDDYSDEWEPPATPKYESMHSVARDYIQRAQRGETVERRPQGSRTTSSRDYFPDIRETREPETVRRSSGRRSGSDRERDERPGPSGKSSGKTRKGSLDILEQMLPMSSSRKVPSMPTANSAPANLKIPASNRDVPRPQEPQRSSTAQNGRDSRHEVPAMRRADTSPVVNTSRRNDNLPRSGSKLKQSETHDSGYSSPGTPETYQGTSPPKASTRYQIVDEDEDYSRGHRTVLLEPEPQTYRRSTRSPSPPPTRKRPTMSTKGSHAKPSRSGTYTQESARPTPTRHDTARPAAPRDPPQLSRGESGSRGKLFREMSPTDSYRYPDEKVSYAPKIRADNVDYGPYSRRGSAEEHRDRDAYAYSRHDSPRHPGVSRTESAF